MFAHMVKVDTTGRMLCVRQVFSASSDGNEDHSCKLIPGFGTSASCPVVAGSAALVRAPAMVV